MKFTALALAAAIGISSAQQYGTSKGYSGDNYDKTYSGDNYGKSYSGDNYGEGYSGDNYGEYYNDKSGSLCRDVHYTEPFCEKHKQYAYEKVHFKNYKKKCVKVKKTMYQKVYIKERKDKCKDKTQVIDIETKLPSLKEVCTGNHKDYDNYSDYKKINCKLVKTDKMVTTKDKVLKWTCEPDYQKRVIKVPVHYWEEKCTPVAVPGEDKIKVAVFTKTCSVIKRSKRICGNQTITKNKPVYDYYKEEEKDKYDEPYYEVANSKGYIGDAYKGDNYYEDDYYPEAEKYPDQEYYPEKEYYPEHEKYPAAEKYPDQEYYPENNDYYPEAGAGASY